MLNERMSLAQIALMLARHPTTITREILRNRKECLPVAKTRFRRNPCAKAKGCKVTGLCRWKNCKKLCSRCSQLFCNSRCEDFCAWHCLEVGSWPYVCNRCEMLSTCPEQRYLYDAAHAQKAADVRASAARCGIDADAQRLAALDDLITPLVLKGQSIYHIWNNHRDEIRLSPATLYHYFDLGLFTATRAHLPRAVHFRPRKKKKDRGADTRDIGERTYKDYLDYLAKMGHLFNSAASDAHDDWDIEFDTVIGRRGGKCLLTIVFVRSELFLARLLDRRSKECVEDALDEVERIFHNNVERTIGKGSECCWWFFFTGLTDNGTEFKGFKSMERSVFESPGGEVLDRMQVYYCDPYSSWQKPRIEVAHTLLRRVLPKGTSFDELTQKDIDLICSHIDSYTRENLGGASPFEVAPPGFCGDRLYKALGLSYIAPDDINLTPGLLH